MASTIIRARVKSGDRQRRDLTIYVLVQACTSYIGVLVPPVRSFEFFISIFYMWYSMSDVSHLRYELVDRVLQVTANRVPDQARPLPRLPHLHVRGRDLAPNRAKL